MRPYLSFILLASFINTIEAQNSHHLGVLPTIDHSGTISNRIDYSFYYFGGINLVNSNKGKPDFFVFYSEQAFTYNISKSLSFTGSYVYERQRPLEKNFRNESRFYIQTTYKYKLNRTTVKHRLRFDGRFIENRASREMPFTSRTRYLLGAKIPFKKRDKLHFNCYNEFFFNSIKPDVPIYGENWAYAGVGYNYSSTGSVEIGPLYIFWVNSPENDMSNFYFLQLSWNTHLDFRKNK